MKKIFGIQAELNITADEDITKSIAAGIKSGSIIISDIIKDIKPYIIEGIKEAINSKPGEK